MTAPPDLSAETLCSLVVRSRAILVLELILVFILSLAVNFHFFYIIVVFFCIQNFSNYLVLKNKFFIFI